MGQVRGSRDSPIRWKEVDLRFSGSISVTYATSVPAMTVLVHLGGRHNLHNTYQRTRHVRVAVEQGTALHRSSWVSGNAAAGGSRLWTPARWVRVLAFGASARRESCTMASAELPMSSDDAKSSEFAGKTVRGYDVLRST